ncbi:hypothetical protein [Gelidibacter maritimus]|uniref:Lipocalin-like domain-containing protein n=1 Tax=Gelidibacter maritimus TaxID=2761487 RepID=A0A7W2R204_9FLAO|nr:hypothetical protein [Gelidibacter maritimus]MBA6151274.1 hypothetical protein [Gelidibacter maritimus]
MKTSIRLLLYTFSIIFFLSVSKPTDNSPLVGAWELTTWTVGIPMALNDNTQLTTNLLDQTACDVNEILTFDNKAIVISQDSFSPDITIRLKEGTTDVYIVEETCAEGVIGYATDYSQDANGDVQFNGTVGVLSNNQLTVIYKNAIKIYNEALTEVIESRDLTLIYTKKG